MYSIICQFIGVFSVVYLLLSIYAYVAYWMFVL